MSRRRLAAIAAIVLAAATVVLAIVVAIEDFPQGVWVVLCLLVAAAAAWFGLVRRGPARLASLVVAALALAGGIVLIATHGRLIEDLAVLAGAVLSLGAARAAFVVHVSLPDARAPKRAVLFYNPKSGGGKAERFHVADEARARHIEPVELARGDDLESLVRDAVARGADGLAMAGGDGSQAIVASVAAELDLPYACIPAGTRNHFALDLGVDREDVVGALDAFVDGGERRVDLAEVNGRVFVNNVSLGLYAEAVQRSEYRDAKLRTLLDAMPDALGPDAPESDLVWRGPGGEERSSGVAILVSNNSYRLVAAIGSGTRPRLDAGKLGIAVLEAPPERGASARERVGPPMQQWSSPRFDVQSTGPVPAGIDGEAAKLDPPLRFRMRPGALRVRIARQHTGASPSVGVPDGVWQGILELGRIAAGR
jgi:diacylglycerol kinase family enzyme